MPSLSSEEFTKPLSDNLGIEKSSEVFEKAVTEAGLTLKKTYTKEEGMKICNQLKKSDIPLIRVIALSLGARIMLKN